MNKFFQKLDEIHFWLEHKGTDLAWKYFFHPHPSILSCPDSDQCFHDIFKLLNEDLRRLFSCFCLACLALDHDNVHPEIKAAIKRGMIETNHELVISFEEVLSRKWIRIPFLVADAQSADLRWALISLGSGPNFPGWINKVFEKDSIEAVKLSSELAGTEANFYFWPMVNFCVDRKTVSGGSLGLPAYLGYRSLFTAQTCRSQTVAATGCLEKTGRIKPVSFIEQKQKTCLRDGFKALICPVQPVNEELYLECIQAEDINQAWSAWKNYAPDCQFGPYFSLCNDSEVLKNSIAELPLPILCHLEQTGKLGNFVEDILKDTDALDKLIGNLKNEISKPGWNKDKVALLMDRMTPELLNSPRIDPLQKYELVILQRFKCNHLGRTEEACGWADVIKSMHETVVLDSGEEAKIVDDFNLSIVEKHNRYRFDPDLDLSVSPVVLLVEQSMLRFNERKKRFGYALNSNLGALFGTLAQNFAFCGPKYLDKTEEYSRQAMNFFGQGKISGRTRLDYLRQHSYLVYAYLDAQMPEKALEHLLIYLELDSLERFDFNEPNPYKHSCVMRFLAEGLAWMPDYVLHAQRSLSFVPDQHPWQLWLKNLAVVSSDEDIKDFCLRKSISMCMKQQNQQETLVPMALQSLCLLHEYELKRRDIIVGYVKRINTFIINSSLDQEHFSPLISLIPSEAVTRLPLLIKDLFPFNYR